ncbi:MAG: DUF2304 domain-containing protein [Candidatus Magasanikbacteria bacterium]
MIIIFQVLFLLFVFFAILSVLKRRKEGLLGPKGMFFWIIFWAAAATAVLWPNSTTILANYLGIGRGTDLVVYVSLAIMFFVIFRLHIKIESIGRDVTKVVRKEALEEKK